MLRIPLVFWWPGTVAKSTVEALTDKVDLHATLAALATSENESKGGGTSLWPYLLGKRRSGDAGKDVVFAAASAVKGGIFMARSERFKVNLAGDNLLEADWLR